jgi:uncharacterized membrane protein YbhN (UPF0104 family)
MTWLETTTLIIASLWNLMTYWILLVTVLPGLTLKQALIVSQASTAVSNSAPGGPAFGLALAYSMYTSWGFRRAPIASALVISGVGDIFAKLAMPVIALAVLALYGETNAALVIASIVGLLALGAATALFALALSSDAAARRVGDWLARVASPLVRLARRPPVSDWDERLALFRIESLGLIKGRWLRVIGASLLSHFSLFLVLLIALRHVGVPEADLSWAAALGAFSLMRLVTALPVTPGGIGIVELGLSASLAVAGGARAHVVAAVLLFRALTFFIQIPIGLLAYLYWRHADSARNATLTAH